MVIPDVEAQIGPQAFKELVFLIEQLEAKHRRNKLRSDFYDMKNAFRDLGIAIPPALRDLDAVVGWPAKAVDMLAARVRMAGVALPGGDLDRFGIPDLISSVDDFAGMVDEATVSALIHASAFILTTAGNTTAGEPPVVFTVYDGFSATGRWSSARRGLESGLVVADTDRFGQPTRFILLTPVSSAEITLESHGWIARVSQHNLGRVPLEPVTYKRRTTRPFGSSRISRAVMSLTESAMRTIARSEVGAEFFSAPQRYLLGADRSAFTDAQGNEAPLWSLVTGRMLMYPDATDATGGELKIGQFPQISMQPHSDQMRMWAGMFAAETGLPVSALGVVSDSQATSAEAIFAAKEDLIIEAERAAAAFGAAWRRALLTGVQIAENLTAVPAELTGLAVRWHDPSTPSRAQATDAVMKQIQAGVLPADSDVALEQLGYTATDVERIKAHRAATGDPLTMLAGAVQRQTSQSDLGGAMKERFDALGVAVRAGVDPEAAARAVGLDGIEFTGAVPVSLRVPERDAAQLEK